ncbi:P-loop containing nucleoside triphosphate hydrolase protein, partial [Cadophora sp. DSE1049]
KGYLLYKLLRTGKSSLSLLITRACDLDIYIFNISNINDSLISKLFTKLFKNYIVLIEDINTVDLFNKKKSQGRVFLSALLNVFDNVSSQERRVLIITTNYVERLDAALIRPS